jgi:hypothetical protein
MNEYEAKMAYANLGQGPGLAAVEGSLRDYAEQQRKDPRNQISQLFALIQNQGTSEDAQRAVAALKPIVQDILARL